jgi:hypothetical protein
MEKLSYIIAGIACAFLLWVSVSWCDVVLDNNRPDPKHSEYNFFTVLVSLWED